MAIRVSFCTIICAEAEKAKPYLVDLNRSGPQMLETNYTGDNGSSDRAMNTTLMSR